MMADRHRNVFAAGLASRLVTALPPPAQTATCQSAEKKTCPSAVALQVTCELCNEQFQFSEAEVMQYV
jgi:hypothetical protein